MAAASKTPPKTVNKGGRPAFKPSGDERKLVQAMAGYGIPEDDIALVVRDGIAPKTLRKHFGPELSTGHVRANAKVAEALYQKATGKGQGAVTAAIFWLKTRARWNEPAKTIFIKPLDQMTETELVEFLGYDPTDEELRTLASMPPVGEA